MELQKQLLLLSLPQLGSFRDSQVNTEGRVRDLIGAANSQMAEIDRQFQDFIGPDRTRLVGNTQVKILSSQTHAPILAQKVDRQSKVRQQFSVDIRPYQQKIVANVALAKVYQSRHWSKILVLNRATAGNGATDAIQRRADYAKVFAEAGKAELFSWAQIAIDTGDAVLADAVYRANGKRPREDRAFLAATFLSLMPNADYDEARKILQDVLDSARRAGLAIAQFEGRSGVASQQLIEMGLTTAGQQVDDLVDPGLDDDPFDAAGGLKPEYFVKAAQRIGDRS